MEGRRSFVISVLVLGITHAAAVVEELDGSFMEYRKAEPWLVEFYAPWCECCKTFDPIWYEVAGELKSMGSPVNVGRMDPTVHTDAVSEFSVRGYPSIVLVRGAKRFDYRGPRTKDAILEFTGRVSGPAVRTLTSVQLFRHILQRHELFFLYIGGRTPLKSRFYKAAAEFVVYNYFFSATEEVLPQTVTLEAPPSVAVFKDGTFHIYHEEHDGSLSSWVDQERFPRYFQMDSFALYQMGERKKLVALAAVDAKNPTPRGARYKTLLEEAASEHREKYRTSFQFGCVDGNEYINGVIMGELALPSLIVMNMTVDGYYLPRREVRTAADLLRFLDGILAGQSELLGGNGPLRQMRRLYFRASASVQTSFASAPCLTCFMCSLPLGVVGFIIAGICTAERAGDGGEGARPAVAHKKRAQAKKKD